jgi:Uma2 family endonuclease
MSQQLCQMGSQSGVVRRKSERGRLSYVLWEENNRVPLLAIEVVSKTPVKSTAKS